MCAGVGMCVPVHVEARSYSWVFFLSAYFLRQHLSLNLELVGPARLGGQRSSGVLLLLPP